MRVGGLPDSTRPLQILSVVGARPNFMKIAPIARELARYPDVFSNTIVHTGQHYDSKLSAVFFDELEIPRPDINLNVGSGSHAQQTAAVMSAFEPLVVERQPDLVLVVGDVNSTLACSLVAAKCRVRVAHVEAGLRSRDREMPEEINRVLTDQISSLLFTTERTAADNLRAEGIAADRIHFVGNVMIDTLLRHRDRARRMQSYRQYGVCAGQYALLTLHRPSNVDDPEVFGRLVRAIARIASDWVVLFPVHPRTRPTVERSEGVAELVGAGRLQLLEPLGYLEFLGLMEASRVVLTDSGGVQEETTILGVPCLTLRTTTERPVTVTHGTNQVVGTDPAAIVEGYRRALETKPTGVPELWDGDAAKRVVEVLRDSEWG
jgi:UDP-N-acetylglucosamine 2-epimerase (non-hydrolysing)